MWIKPIESLKSRAYLTVYLPAFNGFQRFLTLLPWSQELTEFFGEISGKFRNFGEIRTNLGDYTQTFGDLRVFGEPGNIGGLRSSL